jgi:hypothetical protein
MARRLPRASGKSPLGGAAPQDLSALFFPLLLEKGDATVQEKTPRNLLKRQEKAAAHSPQGGLYSLGKRRRILWIPPKSFLRLTPCL